jgi:hypothetical protein
LLVGGAAIALAGCSTTRMSGDQLARVAKDWALGIRASQVIPVYPLTEDLQPGDVFLVQTTIEDQARVYSEKGFLPLESLVVRLQPKGYEQFYRGWPGVVDGATAPPRPWQFSAPEGASADYSRAPLAAFPTYNFSVSRSGGLSMALPVQSVPVGLNLLDTASANGTITLKDAYTYGLPAQLLHDTLQRWGAGSRDYLRQFGSAVAVPGDKKAKKDFYLRVVDRVYLVKTVDVSLFANRATAADGSAGVPGKIDLLNIANATEAAKRFDEVNKALARASAPKEDAPPPAAGDAGGASPIAVGGSVRVAMATSRSVSMVETFARPVVIGYLASDYRILENGELGPPQAALQMLEGRPQLQGKTVPYTGCDANCGKLQVWLGPDFREKANVKRLTEWLARQPDGVAIADMMTGDYPDLRRRAVAELVEP